MAEPATSDDRLVNGERAAVEALAAELGALGIVGRHLAIVLGSGLSDVVEALAGRRVIPSGAFARLPRARVAGHAGAVVLGELAGVPVVVLSGRVHLYEGRSPHETTRGVRALARLGVRGLVLTNASGSLVPEWGPGTLVRLTDHLGLHGQVVLNAGEGSRANPYDPELGAHLERAAEEAEVGLVRGVYAGMLGPAYETPAEIRALRRLGAHVVGMSTVAEASAAFAVGLRVVGLSCVANPAAGLGSEPLRHADVLEVMRASGRDLARLLERVVPVWQRILSAPGSVEAAKT